MNTLLLEIQDGVGVVKLNRPEVLNAWNLEMRHEFAEVIEKLSADPRVKVVVISGQGKAFCSGGDVKGQKDRFRSNVMQARSYHKESHKILIKLTNIEKPVIASVNGSAYGLGFSLALAADICIASENAQFSMAFSKVGLVPDFGGIYFLTKTVGANRGKELVFTARAIGAREAFEMGIVNKVVSHDELETQTMLLAKQLAMGPSQSYALSKMLFNKAETVNLETFLELESFAQAFVKQTKDHQEGVQSFVEKRKAKFSGE